MKAVLVIDMPEDCNRCYLADYIESCREYYCGPADKSLMWRVNDLPRGFKPDWCPLRPLPEEREFPFSVEAVEQVCDELGLVQEAAQGYVLGWNACLEAITGEVEV